MIRRDLMLGFIFLVGFPAAAVMGNCIGQSAGGRGQDSTVVVTATAQAPSSPALVPAPSDRAVGDEVAVPLEEIQAMLPVLAAPPVEPASTVTQSALTATVQAYLVIDPVPATPPAQRVPVGSYAPWPEYLWPVVACLVGRESSGQAWQVSPGGDVGLMQIGPANFVWLAERGISRAQLFDPSENLRAGWMLYVWWEGVNGDGLTPWATTRGGCA